MALQWLGSGGCQPGERSLLQCLRAHTLSIILLPEESDLAQDSRKAEPKARAAHTDALFWALIPDNRKGSEEERNREGQRTCPACDGAAHCWGQRGLHFPYRFRGAMWNVL